jgi:hypothetical protein
LQSENMSSSFLKKLEKDKAKAENNEGELKIT